MEFSLQDELTLLSSGEEYEFENKLDLDDKDSINDSINGERPPPARPPRRS